MKEGKQRLRAQQALLPVRTVRGRCYWCWLRSSLIETPFFFANPEHRYEMLLSRVDSFWLTFFVS